MLPDPSEWMSSDRPLPQEAKWGIPIVVVKAKQTVAGIMLAADLVGQYTHFYFGRTRPCLKTDCQACLKGTPRYWHGYIPMWNPNTGTLFMAELPASAAKHFDHHLNKHKSAERWHIELRRIGENDCGRVHVSFLRRCQATLELPDYPNVVEFLHRLWSIRTPDPRSGKQTRSKSRLSENDTPQNHGVFQQPE